MSAEFRGWWVDGQTAARHRVRIIGLSGSALELHSAETGACLARLRIRGLRIAEDVFRDQPVRLVHVDWPDALLTLDDPQLLERLGSEASQLRRRFRSGQHVARRTLIWGIALVGSVAAVLAAVPLLAALLAPSVPQQWTAQLGEEVVDRIERDRPVCGGQTAQSALSDLTARLLEARSLDGPLTVRILDDTSFNALAAPGGQVRVFDGLIQSVPDRDALAAVLAHELAHVVDHHPTQAAIRQVGWQLVVAAALGDASVIPRMAGLVSTRLLEGMHSRATETRADKLAVAMLNDAGIDSTGMVRLLESLGQQEGAAIPVWLSSHPSPADRIQAVRPMVQQGGSSLTDAQWRAVKGSCD